MLEVDSKILNFLNEIPRGKVSTYKRVGERFGVHPRKVASVMKYNKDPIKYPCYKIVSESGKLNGYSAFDGVDTKVSKLKSDGVEIIDGKINEKYFY